MGPLSMAMGGLGLVLYWVWPLGLILAAVGLLAGLAGLATLYAVGGRPLRQAVVGTLVSAAALLVNLWIPQILGGFFARS